MVESSVNDPYMTMQVIGDELGITRQAIHLILSSHGWRLQRPKRRFCKTCGHVVILRDHQKHPSGLRPTPESLERQALVLAMYEAGYTTPTIKRLVGLPNTEMVYYYLKRHGIPPNRGGLDGHYDRNTEYFIERRSKQAEALALYDSGSSATETARMLGLSTNYIYKMAWDHKTRKEPE